MKSKRLRAAASVTVLFGISGAVDAALFSRLGGLAVYDSGQDVTWLANANLAATNTFGVAGIDSDGIDAGQMNWFTANEWITAMNADGGTGYLGFDTWRLPVTVQPDASCDTQSDPSGTGIPALFQGSGSGCTASEMGHLKHVDDIYFESEAALALFLNLRDWEYWSGTDYLFDTSLAWSQGFDLGTQETADKSATMLYVLPVLSGDVGVPLPPSIWLLGSALFGVASLKRARPARLGR